MPAAPSLPTVSVVVPTGGRRPVLDEALAAALADPASTEVVVVLDEPGSATEAGDRLLDRLGSIDPRVRTMRTPTGRDDLLSLQVARDAGAESARSEVVLTLDDDVILGPGTVGGHARLHAEEEGQVVVGYMPVVSAERWPRSSATIRNYSSSYEYHCECYESDPDSILRQIWGGNFSIRREDWLRSIERPRLSCWGHDDQELGLLFLRQGLRGRFDRSLLAGHRYHRSLSAFVERAAKSPAGQAKLRAANPDLLPEPPRPPRTTRDRISGPFLWISRSAPGWLAVRSALMGLIVGAGVFKLTRVEDPATRYLWFLSSERARRREGAGGS